MGLYTFQGWKDARDKGARYHVAVCWAHWSKALPRGARDTEQTFSSRTSAERFAREIARYLPPAHDDGTGAMPVAWVLVSSLAATEYVARSCGYALCYMAIDAGAIVVKRHDPLAGYFGAPRTACARGPSDTLI